MIPILYASNATDFTTNGLGFLIDAVKASVSEERNGAYELTLQYPVTGQWYSLITSGSIVKTKANETSNPQLFRIYKISKPLKGIVTYNAEHISYDLNGLPLTGFEATNTTPQTAINKALNDTPLSHSFSALSDIATLNRTSIPAPCSVRALLGGQLGSILDVWGGEYEFDNYVIKLHAHRGSDNGVTIEYGKNLIDLKQESNISQVYTHLLPYAKYSQDDGLGHVEDTYVYLTEKVLSLTPVEPIGHSKAYIMDFSDRYGEGEIPTEASLRTKAEAYITSSDLATPKVNLTVSFTQLWQTEEYKNIAPLERVSLCDTVKIRFPMLGVTASAKVIKTVFDGLNEKYESITLGDAKSNFADTILKQNAEITALAGSIKTGQAATTAEISAAIATATSLITGHSGGYVVLNPSEMPQEILILDAPTLEEAICVWRWNSGGLGYSTNGYDGDYALAMTMDGSIVADFIKSGIINGALIRSDSIQSASISSAYKLEVTNEIGQVASAVEQEFVAADERLLSVITNIETVLSGDITTVETAISALQQTVSNLTLSFTSQSTGGINKIRNSSGLNGVSDDWTYTGSVAALQDAMAGSKTVSGSMFRLREGTLSQQINVIRNSIYTLSFRAFRGTAARCYLYLANGGGNTYALDEQSTSADWTDYRLTFEALGDTVTICAGTSGYYFYIADLMLVEGEHRSNWTPAPNEIYTENVKIDRRGINITNSQSATETIIDNTQFAVKHAGSVVLTVNKDLTTLCKTEVTDELTIGKGKLVPRSSGLDLVLLD